MEVWAVWHGGASYAPGTDEDLEHFRSLGDAGKEFHNRANGHGEFAYAYRPRECVGTPAVSTLPAREGGPSMRVYLEDPREKWEQGDKTHPDRIVEFSQTGRLRITPVRRSLVVAEVTEETIGNLFAEGRLNPAEFGLVAVEVRRYGACHPSQSQPCEHNDDTCQMVQDIYRVDGDGEIGAPHCNLTCPNLWDVAGETEGIEGQYDSAVPHTFSYLWDDRELAARVYERAAQVIESGHNSKPA